MNEELRKDVGYTIQNNDKTNLCSPECTGYPVGYTIQNNDKTNTSDGEV